MSDSGTFVAHPHMPTSLVRMAHLLDDRFRIPGTNIRFGWDSLIGLIPGIGDTITAGMSIYIVARARELGAPLALQVRMTMNVLFDWIIGSIPLIGDIIDVGFKANRRNLQLLEGHLRRRSSAAQRDHPGRASLTTET